MITLVASEHAALKDESASPYRMITQAPQGVRSCVAPSPAWASLVGGEPSRRPNAVPCGMRALSATERRPLWEASPLGDQTPSLVGGEPSRRPNAVPCGRRALSATEPRKPFPQRLPSHCPSRPRDPFTQSNDRRCAPLCPAACPGVRRRGRRLSSALPGL